MKKILIFVFIFIFLNSQISPVYAYTQVPAYLCELGIQFYDQGNYFKALHEFNKALIARPGYPLALEYIRKIRQELGIKAEEEIIPSEEILPPVLTGKIEAIPPTPAEAIKEGVIPPVIPPVKIAPPTPAEAIKEGVIPPVIPPVEIVPPTRAGAIKELLDKVERERKEMPYPIGPGIVREEEVPGEIELPAVLYLDENIKTLTWPLEIEQGKSLIISGRNIRRFLATTPEVLEIERKSSDELLVTGKNLGITYLHIWDERDRWTLEFLTIPPKPAGPTLDELRRREEERVRTFKLRYYLDWSLYEKGRRINSLKRLSYGYTHGLRLEGQIPYGDIDSYLSVRSLRKTTDLTSFNLGLTKGTIGPFKDFTLRAFDYSPGITNLTVSNVGLRGIMFKSPAFDKRLDYILFWGREGGGRYGDLSPGLAKTKNSFLSGLGISYSPWKRQKYSLSVLRGWGRDRPDDLNSLGYDLDIDYRFDRLGLNYEIAHDSETFAHLLNLDYTIPRLKLTAEIRNTAKDFKTMTGWGWRVGELGLLSTLRYMPTKKLTISGRLDVSQDRLFPNPENDKRWNQNFNWDAMYRINPLTSLRLDYGLQNELGRISETRTHNLGLSLSRSFKWFRRINTYLNYRHQESKSFTSHSSDYINNKIYTGLRFRLIGELYYYYNREFNWLDERFTGVRAKPQAMETGVDWSGQIFKSPLHGNLRCIYREEKDTGSALSFFAGEDYLEGFAELAYRPQSGQELFCSTRVRNVWAGRNVDVEKRVEADFRAGMRYIWDTGIRWDPVGTIDGYVFDDLNSDGLRQRDEPPVDGIRVWLGKDKSQVTDILGYYKFSKVKARKAYLTIDATTIPEGFLSTGPTTQEAVITHGYASRINFGIASRSEIIGMVFEDVDGDGHLGVKDLPVKGIVLTLEDGTKTVTNDAGRYFFRRVSVGSHTVTLDINSLPPNYLPAVPVYKDLELFEGISYNYNIPLKKIK